MGKRKLQMKMRKLSRSEKETLKRREQKYKERLSEQGYNSYVMVDQTGCFAIVMVEDPETGRKGMLLPSGKIRWTDTKKMTIGGLADTVVSGVTIKRK